MTGRGHFKGKNQNPDLRKRLSEFFSDCWLWIGFSYCWVGKTMQDTWFGLFNYPFDSVAESKYHRIFWFGNSPDYLWRKKKKNQPWIFRTKLHRNNFSSCAHVFPDVLVSLLHKLWNLCRIPETIEVVEYEHKSVMCCGIYNTIVLILR